MNEVHLIVTGMVQGNCWIVGENDACYIVDPGDDADRIVHWVERHYSRVKAILLTHGHFDHCGAVDAVAAAFHCPVYMNLKDMMYISTPDKKATAHLFGLELELKTPILSLDEFKDDNVVVIPTPGHTPGSVSFLFRDIKAVFTGDCLFKYSVGRMDFPGGNVDDMMRSVQLLATLSDDFTIYPGHEDAGTMKEIGYGLNPYVAPFHGKKK